MLNKSFLNFVCCLFTVQTVLAQTSQEISLSKAIELASQNNPRMVVANKKIEQETALKGAAVNFNNLDLVFEAPTGDQLRPGLMQYFDFPTVYTTQYQNQNLLIDIAKSEKGISVNTLNYNVKSTFYNYQYYIERANVLKKFDSIFSSIIYVNDTRYKVGQINNLEKVNGEAKYRLIQNLLLVNKADIEGIKYQFSNLIYGKADSVNISPEGKLTKINKAITDDYGNAAFAGNPSIDYYNKYQIYSKKQLSLQKQKALPGLFLGYLNQGVNQSDFIYRMRFGVGIPVWFWKYSSNIKAAKKGYEISQAQSQLNQNNLSTEYTKALAQFKQYTDILTYFETTGRGQAAEIIRAATESYRLGSINYYIFLLNIDQAYQLELNYLESLKNYNQSVVTLEYLKGENQ